MDVIDTKQHRDQALSLLNGAEKVADTDTIQTAVSTIAQQLNQRFEQPGSPSFPVVMGVMGGAVVVCAQLLTKLSFPLEFDYIHVTRYGKKDYGETLQWKVSPSTDIQGRSVIVIDDILDEGETLFHIKKQLLEWGAAEVILVVLVDKDIGRNKPIKADYSGLVLPDKFLVGCGMDAYGYWRNLPDIWAIKNKA